MGAGHVEESMFLGLEAGFGGISLVKVDFFEQVNSLYGLTRERPLVVYHPTYVVVGESPFRLSVYIGNRSTQE